MSWKMLLLVALGLVLIGGATGPAQASPAAAKVSSNPDQIPSQQEQAEGAGDNYLKARLDAVRRYVRCVQAGDFACGFQVQDCEGLQTCQGVDLIPKIDSFILAEKQIEFTRKVVGPADLELLIGCVGGKGERRLLRFPLSTVNIGTLDTVLGNPETNPDVFEFHPAHGHYHVKDFMNFELLTQDGAQVIQSRKGTFAIIDIAQYCSEAAPAPQFSDEFQGISRGWYDVYPAWLPCQYLDITGVTPGDYLLKVTINRARVCQECTYGNNSVTIPVTIPADDGDYAVDHSDAIFKAALSGLTTALGHGAFSNP